MGPVLRPHARTDRTRDTRVAELWLPAPEDGRPGEGQRLTPDATHNGGRPPPPGTAPHHPRGTQPPQGMQARGTVLGPDTHTPAPTERWWRTPTARPLGGQSGEGQRLTSDAPHTMAEGTPPGDALPPPPQRVTPARIGASCGAGAGSPLPHRAHPGHTGRGTLAARSRGWAAGGGTAPETRRPSQWWKAPPRGRTSATPIASNACPQGSMLWNNRCWVPTRAPTAPGTHRSRYPSCPPQKTGGRGRDSATTRPSQRWQAVPPGDGPPPPPRHAAPTGHAGQGDSV